jgi:hypothetical protein
MGKKQRVVDIPEEAIKKLSTRLEIKISDAGPRAVIVTAAAAAPSLVFEPSTPDHN